MEKSTDPRMHSAEHILNQTMVRMFDCGRAFSAHIEKRKSKCDYRFHRGLTESEIAEIQCRVNEVIRANLPITEEMATEAEARQDFSLARLPVDFGDQIRIVRIGGYDACPCIGPHVGSTKEIGEFHISSVSFEDGVLRVRYKIVPLSRESQR